MLQLVEHFDPFDQQSQDYDAQVLLSEFGYRAEMQEGAKRLQDLWYLTYILMDTNPSSPRGEVYFSPRPMNIVDTARRVLSQNALRYRVASVNFQADQQNQKVPLGKLENVLSGVMYDIDRQQRARGRASARSQVSMHSLLRGAWAYRMHLTNKAVTSTGSPVDYEQYDPRTVLPSFGKTGNEDNIHYTATTLAHLHTAYPKLMAPMMKMAYRKYDAARMWGAGGFASSWMHSPVILIEYSTNDECGLLADLTNLPHEVRSALGYSENSTLPYIWLVPPYRHGFGRSLIQYGNVNGVPIEAGTDEMAKAMAKSPLRGVTGTPTFNADGTRNIHYASLDNIKLPDGTQLVTSRALDPSVTLAGRSILAPVQHLFGDYNRMVALLKDGIVQDILGTIVVRTPSGQAVTVKVGTGDVNYLTSRDDMQKLASNIGAPNAMAILQLINQDISDGSLDLRFILSSDQMSSGFTRARMEQAALIALNDFKEGVEDWGASVGESFVAQYRKGHSKLKDFTVTGRKPGSQSVYFTVDIDDQVKELLIDGKEPPLIAAHIKVALPVDLMARINMAKSAIDPNNPVMGLAMALDTILELDDIDAAMAQIMEDAGNRNPTITLLRLAQSFKENGAPEIAEQIMQDDFRMAFGRAQMAQQGSTMTPSGGSPGIPAGVMPPEMASGGGTEMMQQGRPPTQGVPDFGGNRPSSFNDAYERERGRATAQGGY